MADFIHQFFCAILLSITTHRFNLINFRQYFANVVKFIVSCSSTGQDGEYQSGEPFPEPRFTDHQNGTVTERLNGLIWTKDANLPNGTEGFQSAQDYVPGMNAASYENYGYTDWRLPNIRELGN